MNITALCLGSGLAGAAQYPAGRKRQRPAAVLFYKIWNGHAIQLRTQVDDMPAFSGKLSEDEVWAVVEYLKALRTPSR